MPNDFYRYRLSGFVAIPRWMVRPVAEAQLQEDAPEETVKAEARSDRMAQDSLREGEGGRSVPVPPMSSPISEKRSMRGPHTNAGSKARYAL